MSKRQVLMVLGVLLVIVPFLGFPQSWQRIFVIVIGAAIVGIAYSMAPKVKEPVASDMPWTEHRKDPRPPVDSVRIINQNTTDQQ